ncbi:caspase domain-containing protein [Rhodocollybia butyracea]|uniref:Caspase domain-containing protein n=1 Tax=Rhodocollybia butyracea TaxID=206335 RepID=A0A9P5UFM3_9AGAR|nr:caspase domain-containing protein [Rhodocollybia butyracea]
MPRHPVSSSLPSDKPSAIQELAFPRKKALLIGVNSTLQDGVAHLAKTHKDVGTIKELLIEHYQYDENNITTMIDCQSQLNKDLHPTRDNILRELKALVTDAQQQDHLFFYYAGHVEQMATDDPKEEDGLDEHIVPCDSNGVDKMIKDNTLRQILIENLPARCKLTAVFDACHSGTLLDLDHWRCNHASKFKFPFHRDHEQKPRRSINRQQGLTVYENERTHDDKFTQCKATLPASSRHKRTLTANTVVSTSSATKENSSTPLPDSFPKVSQLLKKTRTSMSLGSMGFRKKSFISRSNTSPHGDSEGPHPVITRRKGSVPLRKVSLDIQPKEGPTYLDRTCESPVQPLQPLIICDGQCRERGEGVNYEEPLVVALSACTDAQRTWESKYPTMTQILVNMLKCKPHPKLNDMMHSLGREVKSVTVSLHKDSLVYKERKARWRRKHSARAISPELNIDEDNDPQLSSLSPLDMTQEWNP